MRSLKHTTVPNLNVAGWYDQEDFVGPTRIYAALEQTDTEHINFFVAGPWNHGGWMADSGRKLGDINWGSDISRYYRAQILAPWFAHWLHDKPLNQPEAITFQMGTNIWKSYDEWPPRKGVTDKKLYLRADGKLSFAAPGDKDGFDSYVSDPRNPVTYRNRTHADVSQSDVDYVAGRGPTLRRAASRCADLGDRSAARRHHGHSTKSIPILTTMSLSRNIALWCRRRARASHCTTAIRRSLWTISTKLATRIM